MPFTACLTSVKSVSLTQRLYFGNAVLRYNSPSLLKLDSVFINLNFPKPRGAFADSGKHNSQKVLENMNSDTLVKG